ncbi:DNA polymerase III subunit gamma/tau, partial [Pyxidicoccus sp. 3LG]
MAIPPTPPVPSGPVFDDLPPSAARPLSFLRNGGSAAGHSMAAPSSTGGPAYSAENLPPSGPLLDGLPPSAARPLSFLRNGGAAQSPAPTAPPPVPVGATPLSRTTEPAPSVRVTNVRRPEPLPPPESARYSEEEDARFYPEENSPEGCASGECLPDAAPTDGPAPLTTAPAAAIAQTPATHGAATYAPAAPAT